jgi:hypothetical protein
VFDHLNVVATSVFVFFFGLVSVLGFVAARWKAADLDHILAADALAAGSLGSCSAATFTPPIRS